MKMHYSHQLSSARVAQIVGAFVIVPLLGLAVVGLFMAKSANLFEDKFLLHTSLSNSYGLEPGNHVLMSGIPIGKVLAVEFTGGGAIDVTFELLARYRALVKEDSVASLTKSAIIMGASQVEISMGGRDKPALADGAFIKAQEPKDYLALLEDVKGEFDREVKPVIESIHRTVAQVEEVAKGVQQAVQTGNRVLANVEQVSREMPALMASAQRSAASIEQTTASLPEITGSVKKTLAVADGAAADVRRATNKLPAIMDAAQETVNNLKATSEAVQGVTKEMPRVMHTAQATLDDVNTILRGAKKTFPVSTMVQRADQAAKAGSGNGLLSLRGDAGPR